WKASSAFHDARAGALSDGAPLLHGRRRRDGAAPRAHPEGLRGRGVGGPPRRQRILGGRGLQAPARRGGRGADARAALRPRVRRGVGRHRVGGDAPHRRLRRAAEAVLGEGRVSRAARALWLAAALVALASGEALATCPPFTGGSGNWLERFAASRGGRAAPPSDAELHDWLRRENIPPIGVVPTGGPA